MTTPATTASPSAPVAAVESAPSEPPALSPLATPAVSAPLTLRLMPDQLHLFDSQGIACHRTVELPE